MSLSKLTGLPWIRHRAGEALPLALLTRDSASPLEEAETRRSPSAGWRAEVPVEETVRRGLRRSPTLLVSPRDGHFEVLDAIVEATFGAREARARRRGRRHVQCSGAGCPSLQRFRVAADDEGVAADFEDRSCSRRSCLALTNRALLRTTSELAEALISVKPDRLKLRGRPAGMEWRR